ncbi:MAG: EamA family transporter [Acidobacteriota bacterium]
MLAVVASLSFVTLDVLRKILGQRLDTIRVVIGINLGASIVLAGVLWAEGVPSFDRTFVLLGLLESLLFALTSLLYVRAVSISPLSLTIPYLGFTPLVSALVALLLLSEYPSIRGWTGIVCVVAGAVLLHSDRTTRLSELLAAPFREPGSWRMLLVAAIWGGATSLDKIAIAHGSEALLGFVMSALSGALLLGVRLLRRRPSPLVGTTARTGLLLASAALVAGIAVLAQFYAYRELFVSYVEAVKRAGGIASALIGVLVFNEGGFEHRIPAACLMFAGMLLLIW